MPPASPPPRGLAWSARPRHTGRVAVDAVDVVVAGCGPAGACAALGLARGGARVVVVDPGQFPRDKACGDLIGPLGLQRLAELGVEVPGERLPGEIMVLGPSGRELLLPFSASPEYPPYMLASPRMALDAALREAALEAGAEPVPGRVAGLTRDARGRHEVLLGDGRRIRCQSVVGADGAMSRVATDSGLVRSGRVLWGFALRCYVDAPVEFPYIVFWEPRPWRALPGYGWLFPGPDGRANVGLGVGVRDQRARAAVVGKLLPDFVADLRSSGLLPPSARAPLVEGSRRGGWIRVGLAGTTPARGRVLLAGDAAALVNPLQGEGMAEAILSGSDAATAILTAPDQAADHYRRAIADRHGRFLPAAGAVHAAMLTRPGAISAAGRLLTAPLFGAAVASGWSVYWNDLLAAAPRSRRRLTAAGLAAAARLSTRRSDVRRDALAGLAPTPEGLPGSTTLVAEASSSSAGARDAVAAAAGS